MSDKVLYFPYIKVPQNAWFSRVLLYWDEIGSIIPLEYAHQPERLGSYMKDLLDVELVKGVIPVHYIEGDPDFERAFLDLLDRSEFIQENRAVPLSQRSTVHIHLEKLGGLPGELVGRRLALGEKTPRWFTVDKLTADLFMAYLASVLCGYPDVDMDPITDQVESLSPFTATPHRVASRREVIDELRIAVLGSILPAPVDSVPAAELKAFKERHGQRLSRFRRHIESFLIDVSRDDDLELRAERIRRFQDGAQEDIYEIRSRMNERRWPRIVLGTCCGLVGAAIPGVQAALAGDPAAAVTGLPGLISAVYAALAGRGRRDDLLLGPLAYAALAEESLGEGN